MNMRLNEFVEDWDNFFKLYLKDYPDENEYDFSPLSVQPDDFVFSRAIGPKGGRRYNTPMMPDDQAHSRIADIAAVRSPSKYTVASRFANSQGALRN